MTNSKTEGYFLQKNNLWLQELQFIVQPFDGCLHRTPVHRECQWKWKPTVRAATCHLEKRNPLPLSATSIALKSFHHSIHLRFSSSSSSSCVCVQLRTHSAVGPSVSLLCTRGRLRLRLDQPRTAHTDTRSCPPSTSPLHCEARSFENFSGRESLICPY